MFRLLPSGVAFFFVAMGNSSSKPVPQKTINAMVIGPPTAGKSTFINSCYSAFDIPAIPAATRITSSDGSKPERTTDSQQLCCLGDYNNRSINLIDIPGIAEDCVEASQEAIRYCAAGYRSHKMVNAGEWNLNTSIKLHPDKVIPNVALVFLPDTWVINREQTTKWLFSSYSTISISESAITFINSVSKVLDETDPRVRPVFIVTKLDVITYETNYSEKQILDKFLELGNNNGLMALENNTFFVNSKKPDRKKLAKILNQASCLVDGLP